MMTTKLIRLAVMAVMLATTTSAFAQIVGDPFGSIRSGAGRQAPPPAYEQPQPQPRQRVQPQPEERGYERRSDRGYDRRDDRGYDRGSDRRGYDRGYDRGFDRGYDRGPDRGYDRGYDDRPRYRDGGRGGAFCVTSRGSCPTPPAPRGAPCRCDIDGLTKRGIIQ